MSFIIELSWRIAVGILCCTIVGRSLVFFGSRHDDFWILWWFLVSGMPAYIATFFMLQIEENGPSPDYETRGKELTILALYLLALTLFFAGNVYGVIRHPWLVSLALFGIAVALTIAGVVGRSRKRPRSKAGALAAS